MQRLKEKGVESERIRRVEAHWKEIEKEVKDAGGKTTKSLSLAIKGEDDKIEKGERAVQQVEKDRQAKERKLREIQDQIDQLDVKKQRLQQRLSVARCRREHLAMQKWAESAGCPTVEAVRKLAAAVAAGTPIPDDARAVAQGLLEQMAPPAVAQMDSGDTDSDDEMDGDDTEPEDADVPDPVRDVVLADPGVQAQIDEIKNKLLELRDDYRRARADAAIGQAASRKRGHDDVPKTQDHDGDDGMVQTLTVDQVDRIHTERIAEWEAKLSRLRDLAAAEMVPPVVAPAAGGASASSGLHPAHGEQAPPRRDAPLPPEGTPSAAVAEPTPPAPSSVGLMARWQSQEDRAAQHSGEDESPRHGTTAAAALDKDEIRDVVEQGVRNLRAKFECKAECDMQERMQRTQEDEMLEQQLEADALERQQRHAALHDKTDSRRLSTAGGGAVGPTGVSLAEHQQALKAAAAAPLQPRRKTRWSDSDAEGLAEDRESSRSPRGGRKLSMQCDAS